jgi:hypothetical protein
VCNLNQATRHRLALAQVSHCRCVLFSRGLLCW